MGGSQRVTMEATNPSFTSFHCVSTARPPASPILRMQEGKDTMLIQSLQIDAALRLTPLEPEAIADAVQNPDGVVWIDLQDFESADLEPWLEQLGFVGLAHQLCLTARERPGFYPLKRELFFVIPVLVDSKDQSEAEYVCLLCRENLLLTLHRGPLLSRMRRDRGQFSESWLADRSIPSLVAAHLIEQSLATYQRVVQIRGEVYALDDQAHRDPEAVAMEDLLDIRSRLWMLSMVINEQLPAIQALALTDQIFTQHRAAREHLNCAVVNLKAAYGDASRLEAKVEHLRSDLQMISQEKTNHRLAVLTVFSAIFMPASLMAGIWGMNFEVMPGLKQPYGYAVALGSMVLIGGGMVLFFRKRGWFD